MHLRSELTSEICQKIRGLDGKTKQNRLKVPTLPPFFSKTTEFIGKRETVNDFLIVKISVPRNFMILR